MSDLTTAIAPPAMSSEVLPPSEGTSSLPAAGPWLTARLLTRWELVVAVVSTLLVAYLHVFFTQGVDALWRDEVNSINVATLPTFGELWHNLEFDSFPVLYFGVLRAWAGIFGADNDMALRVLGLLTGLGIVGALWLNARQFGVRWPLFGLVLLGCNPMFVRYGDSNRAYGLGMLLILLTLAAVWRVLSAPRPGRVLLAMAAAVLSVQTLYYNSVLLFAICAAGALVATHERRWRAAAWVLAVGAPAALSLVVYADTIHRMHEWNFLVQYAVTLPWIWHKLSDVTGSPDPLGVWVWSALFVAALGLAGGWLARRPRPATDPATRAVLFAAAALVVLTIGYPVFLKVLNYYTQPWYYVAYLALVAVCLDVVFGRVLTLGGQAALYGRAARLAGVLLFAALTFLPARASLFARQTNLDFAAAQLNRNAAEGDLVVFNHWEQAITFERYYHGPAPVATVPPLDDHRFHRYDLVKAQAMTADAAAPVLVRMEETLRAGRRVWLVGTLSAPKDGQPATVLAPARMENGKFSAAGDYYFAWEEQVGAFLRDHASSMTLLPVNNEPAGHPTRAGGAGRVRGLALSQARSGSR